MARQGITDMKAEIEARVRSIEEVVKDLEAKIAEQSERLAEKKHRLEITQEFYRLEYGQNSHTPEAALFEMPKRFEGMTVRKACVELLRAYGAMHVATIADHMKRGGREVPKTSLTSVLIRSNDFQRVPGKPNTFQVNEE
jgi:hypothetical protein